jgi:hypothetical protein
MNGYVIMTSTDWRPDRRECDIWFETDYAFCGDEPYEIGKRSMKFARLHTGDILLMHENHGDIKKSGCKKIVGIGCVEERYDTKANTGSSKLFYTVAPGKDVTEYRIKVKWFDLRDKPIDPKKEGIPHSSQTFYKIPCDIVARLLKKISPSFLNDIR